MIAATSADKSSMEKAPVEKPSTEKLPLGNPSTDRPSVDERTSAWQVTSTNAGRSNSGTSCIEAAFCPCVVYARASTRLRYALSGRDATRLDDISYCNSTCWQFCLCFPFYGCFISKMQETVRAFYDIRGTHRGDMLHGCCCPCCSLSINDEEIYRRELMENKLRILRESFMPSTAPSEFRSRRPSAEYKSHKPMVHPFPDVQESTPISPPRSKSATFGIKEEDDDVVGLESIPEMSNTGSATPPHIPEAPLRVYRPSPSETIKEPSPSRSPDPEAAGGKNLTEIGRRAFIQHLGRFFPDSNTVKKENDKPKSDEDAPVDRSSDADRAHSLDEHARYASKAVSQYAAHGLEDHSKAPASTSRLKEHVLGEDQPVPPARILSPPHLLASDPVLSRFHSTSLHPLEIDTEASSHPITDTEHDLTADSTVAFQTPPGHQLDREPLEYSRPKGLWPDLAKHDIQADEVIRESSPLPHRLREDVSSDPTKHSVPHRLEGDEVHESALSRSHPLEGDAAEVKGQ